MDGQVFLYSFFFPFQEDNRLFKWKINGNVNYDNAYVLSEDKSDCIKASENDYENLCNIQSNLRYTADKSDFEISCYAQQTDTFGDILHSNEQFIDVIIGAKCLGFFLLSFPQNERKIYQFCSVCIFFERSAFTFQFLNDKIHNYVKKT